MKKTFLIIGVILGCILLSTCFTWFGWNVCLANVFDIQKLTFKDSFLVSMGLTSIISPITISKTTNTK